MKNNSQTDNSRLIKTDVLVIGAGAAGLIAAGRAAQCLGRKGKVVLVEKMEKAGRKIRITGKGRCNLTNTKEKEDWMKAMPEHADFFGAAFDRFGPEAIIRLLEENGVKVQIERGNRAFPASGKAWDVAEALIKWAQKQGVSILYKCEVKKLIRTGKHIAAVECQYKGKTEIFNADKVIVCTGGKSYPSTGSSGDGYRWMQQCGLRVSPLRPSLVPIEVGGLGAYGFSRLELKNVELSVMRGTEIVCIERGDIFLDGKYFAGPILLRLSRKIVDHLMAKDSLSLMLDLKPALSLLKLVNRIDRELDENPETLGDLLRKFMPGELIPLVADQMNAKASNRIKTMTRLKERLLKALKEMNFPVCGYGSFAEAIVTAGGVEIDQIDPLSMRVLSYDNLYVAGEVLDLDANTGGYNLQIAFSTGFVAGEAAAKGR